MEITVKHTDLFLCADFPTKSSIFCNTELATSWVWNLVSRPKRKTQIEGVSEQGAEENSWTYEGGNNNIMKKTA